MNSKLQELNRDDDVYMMKIPSEQKKNKVEILTDNKLDQPKKKRFIFVSE